jgi:hypothetical protein
VQGREKEFLTSRRADVLIALLGGDFFELLGLGAGGLGRFCVLGGLGCIRAPSLPVGRRQLALATRRLDES